MHKKFSEKVKDFFINMGKQYRILLPLAVVGLALTMLLTKIFDYCKKGTKRFACVLFVICLFLIGNSFAFPNLYFSNGFVSEEDSSDTIVVAESEISLVDDNVDPAPASVLSESDSEYGEVSESDIVSLDEILDSVEISQKNGDEEINSKIDDAQTEELIEDCVEDEFDADDWRLILINKQHPIPEDYQFTLGYLTGSYQCDERIIDDLLLMLKAAKEDGISLRVCSPYRDSERQESLFDRKINKYMSNGYTYIDAYKLSSQAVTVPGSSEHQVGLAIDFISDTYTTLDEGFELTDTGKWLKKHCADYGFALRYPKGKEYITSIEYEPWHFRYVGREAASIMMSEELCLEEFWDKYM